ncbi:HutD family protein [Streptomyces scopuliridis]|uniref:HutD-family protein n=1 Tax=Streptomyces scopuliridis RB72 TaxID=1440053 RepID=A0A2T7SVB3_9ACTN|nr:HutD family protein [Streptomyces scopuliridis]PVE06870.1 HutD-family protein [Streptomyces scopuliridis RB72]
MNPRILGAAGRPAVPWKNGGGVTREIASWPEGAGTADFDWRISLADVAADGPFSTFPGVDRTLTMVEGAGMDLTVGGRRRLVDERCVPADFPGDLPTHCQLLAGPVVNFNVMWHRERVSASVAVVRGCLPVPVPPGATVVAVALESPATLGSATLARYDAALLAPETATGDSAPGPAGAPLTLRSEGPAALVTLRRAVRR